MPPKKKDKPKGSKGPKKLSAKEKKLRKQYASLKIEDKKGQQQPAVLLRADELQWAAEKTMEAVTLSRDERIRVQLERDFLYDIVQTYRKRYECLMIEEEGKIATNNRMHQDSHNLQAIKSIEGKHFRYEAQINCTTMDITDKVRQRRLKDMMEKQWQMIAVEKDDWDNQMDKLTANYRGDIRLLRAKLDDLENYVDHRQLEKYKKQMEAQMKESTKLFDTLRHMENQIEEQRWGDYELKISAGFENDYQALKNFYNDATHSNLTMILSLQDWINDAVERRNLYLQQISEYEELIGDAHAKMPQLKKEYVRKKVKHDVILRTKQDINTSGKELSILNEEVNKAKMDHRHLVHQFNKTMEKRDLLKNNPEEHMTQICNGYTHRYGVKQYEDRAKEAMGRYMDGRKYVEEQQPEPTFTQNYKVFLDKKDNHLEKQKLRVIRVQKQVEDLRRAMEARLTAVGLKKNNAVETPEDNTALLGSTNFNWAPANLTAKRCYPTRKQGVKKDYKCPPTTEIENALKTCPVDQGIQEFLQWKKDKAKAASKKASSGRQQIINR